MRDRVVRWGSGGCRIGDSMPGCETQQGFGCWVKVTYSPVGCLYLSPEGKVISSNRDILMFIKYTEGVYYESQVIGESRLLKSL